MKMTTVLMVITISGFILLFGMLCILGVALLRYFLNANTRKGEKTMKNLVMLMVLTVLLVPGITMGQGQPGETQVGEVQKAKMEVRSVVFSPSLVKFVEYFNSFLIKWWSEDGREQAATGEWRIVILETEPAIIGQGGARWWTQARIGIFKPGQIDASSYTIGLKFGPGVNDGDVMLAAVQAKTQTVKVLMALTKQVTRERRMKDEFAETDFGR